jgi:putative DNA primase/helicase
MATVPHNGDDANSVLNAARDYVWRGWAVIPIPHGAKGPRLKGWQETRLLETDLPHHFGAASVNIGILNGEPSGWLVDVDLDAPEALALADQFLPLTHLIHGRSGKPASHRWYRSEGTATTKFAAPDGAVLVEIRATRTQTVVPPSIHPSSEAYRWEAEGDPAAVAPDELQRAVGRLAACALLARIWPAQGNRHDAALALAGLLLGGGWPESEAAWFVGLVAETAGDEERDARVRCVEHTAQKLAHGEPITGGTRLAELLRDGDKVVKLARKWLTLQRHGDQQLDHAQSLSDLGNARRLIEHHGRDLRHVEAWGWLTWDGRRWALDPQGLRVQQRAKQTVLALWDLVKAETDSRRRDELIAHARGSGQAPRIAAMVKLAASDPEVAAKAEAFDADPYLLNVRNGTIDLHTGAVRPHDPGDLITRLAPVDYDPTVRSGLWGGFLNTIMGGNEALLGYLQRAAGYTVTGDTGEECLFIPYGTGRNGKSKFLEALVHTMGDYAKPVRPEVIMAKQTADGATSEIAELAGARLVASSEVAQGTRFNEALVKQLTGGDTITARFLYQRAFRFKPAFTIWLAVNDKPEVRGTDEGIWSRLKVVPFTVTIPVGERDPQLGAKLRAEATGILTWLVEGCLAWQAEGLNEPAEVSGATREYRAESDAVAQFLEECCAREAGARATVELAFVAYRSWCEAYGERALSKVKFGKELERRGFAKGRTGKEGWFWRDLAITSIPESRWVATVGFEAAPEQA